MTFKFLFALVLTQSLCLTAESESVKFAEAENKLYRQLFDPNKYNKFFRPEKTTVITYALSLAALIELNEKQGYLTTTFIPKMTWKDPRLSWNVTEDTGGITHIQVPSSEIWLPDIEILNRFKDSVHDNAMESLVWIHNDGVIYYVPRQTYQTPCQFDLNNFPFDVQFCQIILGSWAYQKSEVDLVKMANGTDDMFFTGHSDFELLQLTMDRVDSHYGSADTPFVELVVNITLARRTTYFYYMYLLPADLLLFVLPLIHFIPSNKESKMFLLSSIMICSILMMNILEDFMPAYYSSRPPKALKLYFSCMLSVLFSGIITCITMSIANTDIKTSRVPLFLKKVVIGKIGKICCVCTQDKASDYQLLHLEKSILERSDEEEYKQDREMSECNGDTEALHEDSVPKPHGSHQSQERQPAVVSAIQALITELQLARYRDQMKLEWIQLAQVIDRLAGMGFIFSALVILGLYHSG